MARDLELWLEAAPGSELPPDCFASVRPLDGKVDPSVRHCSHWEANRLGVYRSGEAIVVDVYQRVQSIEFKMVEGALQEAPVSWPGHMDVQLRLLASAVCAVSTAVEKKVAELITPQDFQVIADLDSSSDSDSIPYKIERSEWPFTPQASTSMPHGAGPNTPQPMEVEKPYRQPISLNNVDQILPNLYLGPITAASDTEELVRQGIKAVCCCCREMEFPTKEFSKELSYYRVDVEDVSREPIEEFFDEATEFIHSFVSQEQPVLVHCRAGVSRSASVVIAYLVNYRDLSLHDAFFLVRQHRSIVTPNIGFMEKLGDYEEDKRKEGPTIEINKYTSWYTEPDRAGVPNLRPD